MRRLLIPGLAVAAAIALLFVPPVRLEPSYLDFADRRPLLGIPNFSNVVSNVPFLLAAIWGLRALRRPVAFLETWERVAYAVFLTGVALVAFGSAYFHAWPSGATLVWDRLPMTIGFMALFSAIVGERISARAGRLLLVPLLVIGLASVVYWRLFDDLRPYGMVQYFPMLAIALMLILFPPRYTGSAGLIALMACYALAKLLEWQDRNLAAVIATGGHPWKHAAAAAGVFCYVFSLERRRPLCYPFPK